MVKKEIPFLRKNNKSEKINSVAHVHGNNRKNKMPVDFEIHLEFRASNIMDARQQMADAINSLTRLGRAPDSSCLVFSDKNIQKEDEKLLQEEEPHIIHENPPLKRA